MGGYVTLPASMVGSADGARWVAKSLEYVAALPPKPKK